MGLDGMNAATPERWERQRYQRCAQWGRGLPLSEKERTASMRT